MSFGKEKKKEWVMSAIELRECCFERAPSPGATSQIYLFINQCCYWAEY